MQQPHRPHALRFPYRTQSALAVWRTLYFTPGRPVEDPARGAEWNRGAYLGNGLGHCAACHAPRNALARPVLDRADEVGMAFWPLEDMVALLTTGVAPRAMVAGPMAEVVFHGTQYLTDADARAIVVHLRALPQRAPAGVVHVSPPAVTLVHGGQVYERHCTQCHGEQEQGEPGAFAALAGNRAVQLADPGNLPQGGYPSATVGHPIPRGMPPFQRVLDDEELAVVATYVRNNLGSRASGVGTIDAYRARERRGP